MTTEEKILHIIEGLDNKFDNKFDNLQSEVTNMKTEVTNMKTEVTGLREQVGINCKKLDTLQADVSYIKNRIEGNKVSLP